MQAPTDWVGTYPLFAQEEKSDWENVVPWEENPPLHVNPLFALQTPNHNPSLKDPLATEYLPQYGWEMDARNTATAKPLQPIANTLQLVAFFMIQNIDSEIEYINVELNFKFKN